MSFQIDGNFMHRWVAQMRNELLKLLSGFDVEKWCRLKEAVLLWSYGNCLAEIKGIIECLNLISVRMWK